MKLQNFLLEILGISEVQTRQCKTKSNSKQNGYSQLPLKKKKKKKKKKNKIQTIYKSSFQIIIGVGKCENRRKTEVTVYTLVSCDP